MFSIVRPVLRRSACACRLITSSSSNNSSTEQGSGTINFNELFQKGIENPIRNPVKKGLAVCRTNQTDPSQHTIRHEGLYYRVAPEAIQRWMKEGLHPDIYPLFRAFNESCLMVRRPAIEIMECMRAADYSLPAIRYMLYGRAGSGKSSTLAHLMHFCGSQDWVITHVPWAPVLHRYSKERVPSTFKEGRIDQPADAAKWLSRLMTTNDPLLKTLNLKTHRKYIWSRREVTEEGDALTELIDFGLQRVKYAPDVMGAVIRELKLHASSGNVKVLVAIDGVNGMWEQTRYIREESRHKFFHAQELTIVQHLMEFLKNDWTGGASVCTVDEGATIKEMNDPLTSYMPRFLLGQKGFDFLDPFIPVHVPDYSDKEANSCLDYYTDRKWIQHPAGLTEAGRTEMFFLSCKNPLELYKVSRRW
ncbi:hypothetical protein CAPTEDRAFT_179880 [Capitella teleta]|uniref:Small ribosomal subunit protein mS29 n=1 Tax=Capitella teleta TaxID=283909 RepID=R7T444_CAPTE|nr:hypothetical protein CAPTEDRAFT_179880 [Capitella teleta]|eukprot:ELT87608.1 hypothetical protein CAPTEDRAFT_179880 [Capitella teleta]